jgi:ELWxxDGT repeat protein
LYFSATAPGSGTELDSYNGTKTTLYDINPGVASSSPDSLVAQGGQLFFAADDGVHGREVLTFGPDGTLQLVEINPGPNGSNPLFLTYAPL